MATGVKIALIGAGSATFAAGIVRDLCVTDGLSGSHVTLMDVDPGRLATTHRLAVRLAGELDADITFSTTESREDALTGADFVLNTAQVGGHGWTEEQRELAEAHGYYRGARLHNFGQALFFLQVARDIERIAPNARLIQSANPVFEGCTAMSRATGVRVLGLCHGHYGLRSIARVLGLDSARVTAQMPGFNHWIWMTDFRVDGRDAYPLIDEWIDTKAEAYWARDDRGYGDVQMSRGAIHQYRKFGLMPIGDTPRMVGWWHHRTLEDKQHWFGKLGGFDSEIGWARYLVDVQASAERVERAAADDATPITDTFPAKQSGEQIVPIIDSLVNDVERVYQVNVPNRGHVIAGFPEDLVIECQGVVNGAGIHAVSASPFPPKVLAAAMIPRWHEAELMIQAVLTGDPDFVLQYLLADHRTQTLQQAERLVAAWLEHPRNTAIRRHFAPS